MILLVDSKDPDSQSDLGLCYLHMPEDTLLHGAAHLVIIKAMHTLGLAVSLSFTSLFNSCLQVVPLTLPVSTTCGYSSSSGRIRSV